VEPAFGAAKSGKVRTASAAGRIDSSRVYSLAEFIDLAEEHNPETRLAWERAGARLAIWCIARSEW